MKLYHIHVACFFLMTCAAIAMIEQPVNASTAIPASASTAGATVISVLPIISIIIHYGELIFITIIAETIVYAEHFSTFLATVYLF
jgi:hypothetical protein